MLPANFYPLPFISCIIFHCSILNSLSSIFSSLSLCSEMNTLSSFSSIYLYNILIFCPFVSLLSCFSLFSLSVSLAFYFSTLISIFLSFNLSIFRLFFWHSYLLFFCYDVLCFYLLFSSVFFLFMCYSCVHRFFSCFLILLFEFMSSVLPFSFLWHFSFCLSFFRRFGFPSSCVSIFCLYVFCTSVFQLC